MFKNIKEAVSFIKENDIQFVDLKLVDLRGRFRHLSIPAERLNEKLMSAGIGFDASNYGYASVEKSDMVFYPDLSTAYLEPFTKQPTLSMMADVYVIGNGKENHPFSQYPRNVVRAAVDLMKKEGVGEEMIIGPEYEFSVFDSMAYRISGNEVKSILESRESQWSSDEYASGYHTPAKGGYHYDLPTDIHFDLRNEICRLMKDCGIDVKYHHHEVGGSGQMEIEVELGEMCKMADATMMTKYMIRNAAANRNLTATLMPKPIFNEAGNGMHVHMLVKKDGKNIFYHKDGYANLSDTAMYFIGGLLKHIASLSALLNPSTNSYRRLVPGFEAPVTIGYASANRSAVIRIPSYAKSEDAVRFELRSPDATCNPYFAYAAILMAGLDGIRNKIDMKNHNWGPFDFNLYDLSDEEKAKLEHLPASLKEALEALKKDHDYLLSGDVFSEELLNNWIREIEKEVKEIEKIPHPAEFKLYYDL